MTEKVEELDFEGLGFFRCRGGVWRGRGAVADHKHQAVEILLPSGLRGEALTPMARVPFHENTALVLPANLVHATWGNPTRKDGGLRFVQISARRLAETLGSFSSQALGEASLRWLLHGNSAFEFPVDSIRGAIDTLFTWSRTRPEPGGRALLTAFSLVHRILEMHRARIGAKQEGAIPLRSPWTEEIIAFLEARHGEKLSLAELAARFACSPNHLCRQFKRRTGRTPGEYLRHIRITRAMKLIMDGAERMGDVGHAVGFDDLNHFARCFKALTGETPKRFQLRRTHSPGGGASK